ncbi:MAG: sigma-54 dependent transcriptional regulator, partial [Thiohalocapsa sp.]
SSRVERVVLVDATGARMSAFAVPVTCTGPRSSCLYLEGPADAFVLKSSDLLFLKVVAHQVAMALERARLTELNSARLETEQRALQKQVDGLLQVSDQDKLIYRSPQMKSLLEGVLRVAPSDATVLIAGESGSGKEGIARTLHDNSERFAKPYVAVDCGAISPNLLESELFGHVKGAYTGAGSSTVGRVRQAEGGTLFLDEIGELPLDLQAKLLRFIENKEVTAVGASQPRKVDLRIVAATNRDLPLEVAEGRFRQDLYYRLNVVALKVPPLRERPADILPLAQYFVGKFALQYGPACRRLGQTAEELLLGYSWPGNVRELRNLLHRAVLMTSGNEICAADLAIVGENRPDAADSAAVASESPDQPPLSVASVSDYAPAVAVARRSEGNGVEAWRPAPCEDMARVSADPWSALRARLVEQLDDFAILARAPLGSWLAETLVLSAHERFGSVARRAADALGMAESTYRRRLEKARQANLTKPPGRIAATSVISIPLMELLGSETCRSDGASLFGQVRGLLLELVTERVIDNDPLAAALMGITTPTYRRWRDRAEAEADGYRQASG